MSVYSIITIVAAITAALILFTMGLALRLEQVTAVWRHPVPLLRSIGVVILLIPGGLLILTRLVELDTALAMAFVVILACPGPVLGPKLAERGGGNTAFSLALMASLVILAVVTTPLTLALGLTGTLVSPFNIAGIVLILQILPLGIGLAISHFWASRTSLWVPGMTRLTNILFPLVVLLVLVRDFSAVLAITPQAVAICLVTAAIALLLGRALGGRDAAERVPTAVMASFRNGALALVLAPAFGSLVTVIVIAYEVIALLLVIAYVAVARRRIMSVQSNA